MLNIQHVTEAIHVYRRNKSLIKKLSGSDHPAILATEAYLKILQLGENLLSNQDLFNINRFFLCDHPVKPGKASYKAWVSINYQNFCPLNHEQAPLKNAGFATCEKAGYQQLPAHFSKLTREHLDKKSKAEKKMLEFFQVLSQAYQQNNFTDDCFLAYSKLCMEDMLNQDYIYIIQKSTQANFLAECLIKMKHANILTPENQQFISIYSGAFIISVTQMLIALDKAGLNTSTNRQILANFSNPLPLHHAFKFLEKIGLLTQENFEVIAAEDNLSWLLALEEMPEDLITVGIWQGLLNLSKTSNENDFKKDVKDYAELLKKQLNKQQTEKDILISEEAIDSQAVTSTSRFFSVTPVNPPAIADTTLKVSFVFP